MKEWFEFLSLFFYGLSWVFQCLTCLRSYGCWIKLFVVFLTVFNATFNTISVISWWSILLVEETGGPGENHRPIAGHWQTVSHNGVHSPWSRFKLTTSVVIATDCIGSYKSNYHTITTTTAPCWMKPSTISAYHHTHEGVWCASAPSKFLKHILYRI